MALETGETWYVLASTLLITFLMYVMFYLGNLNVTGSKVIGGLSPQLAMVMIILLIFCMLYFRIVYIGVGELPSKWLTTSNYARRKSCEADSEDLEQQRSDLESRMTDLQSKIDSGEACADIQSELEDTKSQLMVVQRQLQATTEMNNNGNRSNNIPRPDR